MGQHVHCHRHIPIFSSTSQVGFGMDHLQKKNVEFFKVKIRDQRVTVGSWSKGMVDIPLPSLPKSSGYLVRIGVWNPERPAQKVVFLGSKHLTHKVFGGFLCDIPE